MKKTRTRAREREQKKVRMNENYDEFVNFLLHTNESTLVDALRSSNTLDSLLFGSVATAADGDGDADAIVSALNVDDDTMVNDGGGGALLTPSLTGDTGDTTLTINGHPFGRRDSPYLGWYFAHFRYFYAPIHGYLSLMICIFGIIANSLNVIVLTRYVYICTIS